MADDEIDDMKGLTELLKSANEERRRLTCELKATVRMHKKNGKLLSDFYGTTTEDYKGIDGGN